MWKKLNYYDLIIVNENSLHNKNEWMNEKTMSLLIVIQQHYEKLIFDIINMINHDVVLIMPWLKTHNLIID